MLADALARQCDPDGPGRPAIWTPSQARAEASGATQLRHWLAGRGVELDDYAQLWDWSTTEVEEFWAALWDYFDIIAHTPYDEVLTERSVSGAHWFTGATLNYAEHSLRHTGPQPAMLAVDESGSEREVSRDALRAMVGAAAAGLRRLGVRAGDRVAGILPNTLEAAVAFLASASVGAVWAICPPEFGARGILDRLAQIEPRVVIAATSYAYNGRRHEQGEKLAEVRAMLPSIEHLVSVGPADAGADLTWQDLTATEAPVRFEPVPFEHPLWILYSSGTTGPPKAIVHGHGGMLLTQLKTTRLQHDLQPGSRMFWYTTTGWMMWNYLLSGLLCGATVVLYDGGHSYPGPDALWQIAARYRPTLFGISAGYVESCMKAGVRLPDRRLLASITTIGVTGSTLNADGFRWLADQIGPEVLVAAGSGGTDICTGIVSATGSLPLFAGEIQCPALAVAAATFDDQGREVIDEVGELVITEPMPSMPLYFWNDPDGSRLHEAYFDTFPGVWRHGDWARFTRWGTCIIEGRSDATLNRGGVRMGTAEFYRVVDETPEVLESLVVDVSRPDHPNGLILYVRLRDGVVLDDDLRARLAATLRRELSPRHVPDQIVAITDLPRTLTGKKCEVPVKKILLGVPVEKAISPDAMLNPGSLAQFTPAT